jgi:hypothetical protein
MSPGSIITSSVCRVGLPRTTQLVKRLTFAGCRNSFRLTPKRSPARVDVTAPPGFPGNDVRTSGHPGIWQH